MKVRIYIFLKWESNRFVDRRFIYNFIRNQNELDDHAVDVLQFHTVLGINTNVFWGATEAAKENRNNLLSIDYQSS